MPQIAAILDTLESLYGKLTPSAPTDPYLFLVWWHCGYPASEDRCGKGWIALSKSVGVTPEELLAAAKGKLVKALTPGGMVPELRAKRLREIATRTKKEFAGELRAALKKLSPVQARGLLKTFPGIGNPGADRIALFAQLSPLAAVPSNCPHVLVRIMIGHEADNYSAAYGEAQSVLETLPATYTARIRAFLLLSRHGRELCVRKNPKCDSCPLAKSCAFARRRR